MKIAIIGGGISGLTAAYNLYREHQISVFESENKIGGHTATVDIEHDGIRYAIDTGFIVFNDWTYPNFIDLLNTLDVPFQPTRMSFSVSCQNTGLEYAGSSLNTLFAQRKNLFLPSYWKMLLDIVRFNKEAINDLENNKLPIGTTLGEYLEVKGYGTAFIDQYLIPMGSAIWSASTDTMMKFPLLFFVNFFKNHGLLSIKNRPQWHVIRGGSRSYLGPLTAGFRENIQTNCKIDSVKRVHDSVKITFEDGSHKYFDHVIFGCHSDQALKLLADASENEQRILSAIPYQKNEVVLHTDSNLLPRSQLAWSSWNYLLRKTHQDRAVLTYNMNILQGINSPTTFCVTLNASEYIAPEKILDRFEYSHPVFSLASVDAANRWQDINGTNRTWFAGAYWGNGFHEDGVVSGLRVANALKAMEK